LDALEGRAGKRSVGVDEREGGLDADEAAAWPAARSNHAAVYDPLRGTLLIFGGAHDGITLGDIWQWDGVCGVFADRTPPTAVAPAPGARASHALVHVNSRPSALLFGGCCSTDDMWEWVWAR
jgi:hypothetical protein